MPDPDHQPADVRIADGRERKLDPQSIPADRVASGIFALILTGASLIGVTVAALAGSWSFLGILLLFGGWFAAAGAMTGLLLWWPALSYRHTFYDVSPDGIRIRRGVIFRTASFVPRSRVQHTDVAQGPVQRAFGIATLVIYTAGTHNASVSLGGLSHETALAIRDHLIVGGQDDAV
jgi:membrane protein YdbS with pleckstrin-like domain